LEIGKNPKAFFLAVTEGKFHNTVVLFCLPSGHETVVKKTQKSTVYCPRSTRPSIIFFYNGCKTFPSEEINQKSWQVTWDQMESLLNVRNTLRTWITVKSWFHWSQ